ncbi:MAG: PilZ domain-containing protein [Candidatus Omnitrophica bacterium]|nr:PilZ domain-containing protein [Candidatus Omnitrophota bacterium]
MTGQPQLSRENRRVFLRVPANMPAEIRQGDCRPVKAVLRDLSAEGVGLTIGDPKIADALSRFFTVSFRLRVFGKPVQLMVEVKNRTVRDGKALVSCFVTDAASSDRNAVLRYIQHSVSFGLPYILTDTAAFLCCLDALWRVPAHAIYLYFAGTPFGKEALAPAVPFSHTAGIIWYAVMSFSAFLLLSRGIPSVKALWRFPAALAALGLALLFLAGRLWAYARMETYAGHELCRYAFLLAETALFVYCVIAIGIGVSGINKIKTALVITEKSQG